MTPRIPHVWGATAEEIHAHYPCDAHLRGRYQPLFRAVTVRAEPAVLFRWLCQLKVSSYSFAFLFGMPTPKTLTPGAGRLEPGQRFMDLFDLVGYDRNRHLTLAVAGSGGKALYGDLVVSYVVRDLGQGSSRLVVKTVHEPGGVLQKALRPFLTWGDLFMMRRQLRNLKRFAERGQLRQDR
ncbi:hypothetical protein [Nonomuraea typhae]|uniref:DUF2867 domain-containing protein n=1 Tax=Nonomuraea typhae TaxID=2603600 RepID=A0ABW7YQC7_9ACTN